MQAAPLPAAEPGVGRAHPGPHPHHPGDLPGLGHAPRQRDALGGGRGQRGRLQPAAGALQARRSASSRAVATFPDFHTHVPVKRTCPERFTAPEACTLYASGGARWADAVNARSSMPFHCYVISIHYVHSCFLSDRPSGDCKSVATGLPRHGFLKSMSMAALHQM